MGKVKLVAESIQEYANKIEPIEIINEEELNESSKASLEKFLKAPDKYPKSFVRAFGKQLGKAGGDKLKGVLGKLDTETKKKLAQQSLKELQDGKKGYAWLKIKNGKIIGAGALGVKGDTGLVGSVGKS